MPGPDTVCPYVGLQPYTEADRDYFFGRDRDQRVIVSNLYAAPLTVLYGASGVGKSSVLLAGVVPRLRAAPRTAVVVFREWQSVSFLNTLKSCCLEAVAATQQKLLDVDPRLPFDDLLCAAADAFGGSILILFDQFEEYFLYHPESETSNTFDGELARAINRDEVDASFLIALREEGLSKLDRFRTRIPNLLGNTLRLQHMDAVAAEEAIRKPLEVYNSRLPVSAAPMTIEEALVPAILAQVRTGQVWLNQSAGTGQAQTRDETVQIETPFLQLVMTRLWDEEIQTHSRALRLSTLERLGGAQEIVRTHLDSVMAKLGGTEQEVCSRFFDRLVTPSGSKIACGTDDLTRWAGNLAAQVPAVLKTLSDNRILRTAAAPADQQVAPRAEIFHDVLAPAVLNWRARYVQAQERAEAEKQIALKAAEEAKEAARQRELEQTRALTEEQRRRIEEQDRAARRQRVLMAGLIFVFLVAVGTAAAAWRQAQLSEKAKTAAEQAKTQVEMEKKRAEVARTQAEQAKTQAEVEKERAEAALLSAQTALDALKVKETIAQEPTTGTAEGKQAQQVTDLVGRAQTAYAAATRVPDTAAAPAASAPLIYIQFQDKQQQGLAMDIQRKLKDKGFNVPGIQRLDVGPTADTEVRFFRRSEESGANEIVRILQSLGVTAVKAKYIPGYEDSTKVQPKQYEIWFAPNVENKGGSGPGRDD